MYYLRNNFFMILPNIYEVKERAKNLKNIYLHLRNELIFELFL